MVTAAPAVLNDAQVEQFHRDGYMKFKRVIDPAQLEQLRARLASIVEEELSEEPPERPPEFVYGHARKGEDPRTQNRPRAIHQFVNMWKVAHEFRDLQRNPDITSAVRRLMGAERLRLWHDQVISKPPGDNGKFAFHHDFYFWPLDRPRMISCWLALDDATADNGCMHVIPGSHRDPRYQPVDCELTEALNLSPIARGEGEPMSLYDAVRGWDADRAVPVELKAGECMFHHCLNYHMTPQNVTDRERRAFVMIFMPDGTRYKHEQSPNHPCTSYLHLEDGSVMDEENFPLC